MSQIVPPLPPPLVDVPDEPPMRRVQRRLLQIGLAAAVVFATAWCYQLHIALGLTATFLAKISSPFWQQACVCRFVRSNREDIGARSASKEGRQSQPPLLARRAPC